MSIPILLASGSPYRQAILNNLGIHFNIAIPNIDETPKAGELPQDLVKRLAINKSLAVHANNTYIIASDQIAVNEGKIIGKPGTIDNAFNQLMAFSGRSVKFYTGLSLRYNQKTRYHLEPFVVHFQILTPKVIKTYLEKEHPLDCAGSFKAEGLGMLLFNALEGRDPNALIGLPVIALNELFKAYGVCLLTDT